MIANDQALNYLPQYQAHLAFLDLTATFESAMIESRTPARCVPFNALARIFEVGRLKRGVSIHDRGFLLSIPPADPQFTFPLLRRGNADHTDRSGRFCWFTSHLPCATGDASS